MSTGTTEKTAVTTERPVSYIPLGETSEITLTLGMVKKFLCVPTRSGKMPSDEQVIKFMMLCKAQSLNPWVSDAWLVGYDGKDGPQFSLITAHQAFLKRAEASPEYEGMESGIVAINDKTGELVERQGDLLLNGETLVGGWARVFRSDRKVPSYDALNLSVFSTGRSRWLIDPAGLIVKCSEASALRKAFPSMLAMYCKEEMDRTRELHQEQPADSRPKTDRLAARLGLQDAPTMPVTIDSQQEDDRRETVPTRQRETVHEMPETMEADHIPDFGEMVDKREPEPEKRPADTLEILIAEIKAARKESEVVDIVFRRSALPESERGLVEQVGRQRKEELRKARAT